VFLVLCVDSDSWSGFDQINGDVFLFADANRGFLSAFLERIQQYYHDTVQVTTYTMWNFRYERRGAVGDDEVMIVFVLVTPFSALVDFSHS